MPKRMAARRHFESFATNLFGWNYYCCQKFQKKCHGVSKKILSDHYSPRGVTKIFVRSHEQKLNKSFDMKNEKDESNNDFLC